jgi:tight adherence protein B
MAALLVAVLALVGFSAPAYAAQGSIDHVETDGSTVKVLFSLPGTGQTVQPDLGSVSVTVNGKPLKATATLASDAKNAVRRTAILAIDTSKSMAADNKFTEAKQAANAFLDTVPSDVYVGIVTFAGAVKVAQAPTLDRQASKDVVNELTLSLGTHLYDGVRQAVASTGVEGQRNILVLSDGRDTSGSPEAAVTSAIEKSGVKADVVALAQSAPDEALLRKMAEAGGGSVLAANDPSALKTLFANEAQALASQVLVTATRPSGSKISEGSLAVSIDADGQTYTDSAYVTLSRAGDKAGTSLVPPESATKLTAPPAASFSIPRQYMLGGLAAAGIGFLVLLLTAFGVFSKAKRESVEERVAAYTRKGARKRAKAAQPQAQGMAAQAVGFAEKALEGNKGIEVALGDRLDAAGLSLKPAEWLLAHAGVAIAFALIGLLLTSGNIFGALVGLVVGAILPWAYLGFKRSRRLKAFKGQLAETLQLMSGSLSAGLSLAQSVDTVVREGGQPLAGEFRRALVETRLGVSVEDALEGVASRMQSVDFHWVVMAIRIQREVGGNLAELLNTVAATIREREYLARQVQALSAEGRLSVWILGGLPPGFMGYLLLANRAYLQPLISTMMGWVLLGVMAVLLTGGILWMKKLVKVEV